MTRLIYRFAGTVAALGLVAAVVLAVRDGALGKEQPPPETIGATLSASTARLELGRIAVAPAGPMTGYSREQIFPGWADVDHDGCDTRDEIMMRDAAEYTPGHSGSCIGTIHLEDPYGQGPIESIGNIQIDHVVPLAAAWRAGGRGWNLAEWERFANDPANLLAVEGGENMSKGDQTPDEWMPPDNFRCDYAKIYVDVTSRYRLTLTQSTKDSLARTLREEGCR